jgi:hypothetical protein
MEIETFTKLEFCFCTHSTLAHESASGRCRALLCGCRRFRLQATLIQGSPIPEPREGELLVTAPALQSESFDRLAAAALSLVSQQMAVKIWLKSSGVDMHYSGGGPNIARGKTILEAFREMLR